MTFNITQVEQPEVAPVQTFYAYFCDGPEDEPRMEMLALLMLSRTPLTDSFF